MKSASIASQAALALSLSLACSSPLTRRQREDYISSCGDIWMPREDVSIGRNTDTRTGYNSAVDQFCDAAAGRTLGSGDTYLSYATETELSFGKPPARYGQFGFVYCESSPFEIHNRQDVNHRVNANDCKTYLKHLSEDGGKCSGDDNNDSKGGTWQVINGKLSYHALPNTKPPRENALNRLVTQVIHAQSANKGSGPPLNPFPLASTRDIKPVNAHSHNDYDREIPLYTALATGCISVEADIFLVGNDVEIGHSFPKSGRTLRAQYINPLRAVLDAHGGSVYPANPSSPSFTLLVDFKSSAFGTLDAVVSALSPLREAGYLSRVENGRFVEKAVTVVASGNAPFDRIKAGDGVPQRDVFYDADITALGARDYSTTNSYYASANYKNAGTEAEIKRQIQQAHDLGLKVRYYDLNSEDDWEMLAGWGVDRLNADDLPNTARLPRY